MSQEAMAPIIQNEVIAAYVPNKAQVFFDTYKTQILIGAAVVVAFKLLR